MFIKEIVIEKDGQDTERIVFRQGLSVAESSEELHDIIKLLLGNNERKTTFYNVHFAAEVLLDKTYYFFGEKNKDDQQFNFVVFSDNKKDCEKECKKDCEK